MLLAGCRRSTMIVEIQNTEAMSSHPFRTDGTEENKENLVFPETNFTVSGSAIVSSYRSVYPPDIPYLSILEKQFALYTPVPYEVWPEDALETPYQWDPVILSPAVGSWRSCCGSKSRLHTGLLMPIIPEKGLGSSPVLKDPQPLPAGLF